MKYSLILSFLFISTSAFAGKVDGDSWAAMLNVGMYNHTSTTVGTIKQSATATDVTVGYSRAKGFYLGGIYGSGSGTDSYSHMGVSMGYVINGWDFMAHYLLGGTYKMTSADYKDGTGSQIDVGYLFKTGIPLYVGIQVTSRSMTYKSKTTGSPDLKTADTYPAIKIAYFW
jgi:hypothetical protein